MRVVIKNADFSNVSIGKVIEDLSFRVSANTATQEGVHGFVNYEGGAEAPTTAALINSGVVTLYEDITRLVTDYIEVCEGMTITFDPTTINTSNRECPYIVCYNEEKTLYTDPSTYASYMDLNSPYTKHNYPFIVPAGVKYIKIQSNVTSKEGKNIYIGSMPE